MTLLRHRYLVDVDWTNSDVCRSTLSDLSDRSRAADYRCGLASSDSYLSPAIGTGTIRFDNSDGLLSGVGGLTEQVLNEPHLIRMRKDTLGTPVVFEYVMEPLESTRRGSALEGMQARLVSASERPDRSPLAEGPGTPTVTLGSFV